MIAWRYRTYYSIIEDEDVSRVSGFDERGQEHWMIVEGGKGLRERRDDAAVMIENSIKRGEPAGEVEWVDLEQEPDL